MEGEVLVLTLNRPEKANAMNEAMQIALVEKLCRVEGGCPHRGGREESSPPART